MDVSRWPLGRIMQLPDHCFGRRWPITVAAEGKVAAPSFDISEASLPETSVVWEFAVNLIKSTFAESTFEIRLGDVLPTTWAEFQQYELLFPFVHKFGGLDGNIYIASLASLQWTRLRMPVQTTGRRLVVGVNVGIGVGFEVQAGVVISSIPREVPDCLLSV